MAPGEALQAEAPMAMPSPDSVQPRPAPLIAAYDVGKWLNRLGFLLPQAYLGRKSLLIDAEEALGKLGRAARGLVPPAERVRLRDVVTGPIEALLRDITDGRHDEYLMECNDELVIDSDDANLDRRRELILQSVFQTFDAVRRIIENRLHDDPVALLASQLGELIDQGICPPNVYHYLYEPPPLQYRPKYEGPRRSLSVENIRKTRLWEELEMPEYLLANVTRRPGSVLPSFDWFEEVRTLLDELNLANALPLEVDGMAECVTTENIVGIVDRIDTLIRTALQQRQEERGAEVVMAAGGSRRQVAERDEKSEARSKFAYDLCCDTNILLKQALIKFRERATEERWQPIGCIQGLKYCASEYAKRHDLDPLPKRQGK